MGNGHKGSALLGGLETTTASHSLRIQSKHIQHERSTRDHDIADLRSQPSRLLNCVSNPSRRGFRKLYYLMHVFNGNVELKMAYYNFIFRSSSKL